MTYKLICFDLDGVLVDAVELHYRALNMALMEIAGDCISREEHNNIYNGLPTKTKLKKLFDIGRIEKLDMITEISNKKQEFTRELIKRTINEDSSKIELLNYIKSKGLKIVCVSNSIKDTIDRMLFAAGIKNYFDCLISNEDVVNPKPSPEGYIEAMRIYNSSPNETIIVEDSDHGYAAAVGSGALTIRVSGPEQVNLNLVNNII